MKLVKRIAIFAAVNILIITTISTLLSLAGLGGFSMGATRMNWGTLALYCGIWGMGGAFISLALSRLMARWMTGTRIIGDANGGAKGADPIELELVSRVHQLARQAGLQTMPQVGIYDSPEINAFATGPTRNRALVAVSSGLLHRMNREQVEGVLAHEVAHIANGDMVTMTLIQGVVNAFVMFLARAVAWFAGQFVEEERRPMIQFGITLVLEIGLGILGMLVVSAFSRHREFRADEGGARLAGAPSMLAALKGLQSAQLLAGNAAPAEIVEDGRAPALAALKISGREGGITRLFSTHPDLNDRIQRLEELALSGRELRRSPSAFGA